MLNLIIFGPPGSGKGTQSLKLADKYKLVHISTGDIFRSEIKNKTELGLKVQGIIERGELVPDELLKDILRTALKRHPGASGFLFDGFPRTIQQAEDLESLMKELGSDITSVIALEVDDEEVVKRLLKRAEIEGRKDDTEDVIRNRLNVYKKQTTPLLEFYQKKSILGNVNGIGSIDTIFDSICRTIRL
jgi:adenylate kinase